MTKKDVGSSCPQILFLGHASPCVTPSFSETHILENGGPTALKSAFIVYDCNAMSINTGIANRSKPDGQEGWREG